MTLSKSGRFRAEASFQQPPPSSISSINLSYFSLSVASFIAAKHIALARAHRPRQPNPHSVCGSSLAQSTRGFVLWRLPDAGPGARRSISLPQANETAANLPEPNDRTRLSYTLALSKWAAMGNASSVLLVYFPKVFWASLIRAPRDESLACDTGPANGDPAT